MGFAVAVFQLLRTQVRLKLYSLWHNEPLYRRTWYETIGARVLGTTKTVALPPWSAPRAAGRSSRPTRPLPRSCFRYPRLVRLGYTQVDTTGSPGCWSIRAIVLGVILSRASK